MALKKSELYSSLWQSCDELRGGMDASQYKDYVLVLLFMKYVSDKAASTPGYLLDVPKGGSFADMVALKGDKEIGDKMNKIVAKLAAAEAYFQKWYGDDALRWLEQFRFKKNDELELLATVDMAMEDLRRAGTTPSLKDVKAVIHDHPEWEAKLDRPIFSDANIAAAMKTVEAMLGSTGEFKST